MMNVSIYSTLFNPEKDLFDIAAAIRNWEEYADEIVIATVKGQATKVKKYLPKGKKIKIIVDKEISLDDPLYDGKLKNCALQACSNEIVIQQDMDERLGGHVSEWQSLISQLEIFNRKSAVMIPVIDLFMDLDHYKSVGGKWYLHKKQGCFRGAVNFARREDGTVDTDRSDSCELIDKNGALVEYFVNQEFFKSGWFNPEMPHVIHLGYLDLDKRAKHNADHWENSWSRLNGKKVNVAKTVEELKDISSPKKHLLVKEWWI